MAGNGAAKQTSRDPWIDNARWFSLTLVVLSHVTSPYAEISPVIDWFWFTTWPVRAALFAVLVGYFSTQLPDLKDFSQLVRRVLLPLAMVSLLHATLTFFTTGRIAQPDEPQYTLWFLYGIIIWRALLPYLAAFRWPLLFALILSIVGGFGNWLGDEFALRRVFAYLPLFMLGWWLKDHDKWIRNRSAKKTAIATSALTIALGIIVTTKLLGLLQRDFIVGVQQLTTIADALGRVAVMAVAATLILATLYLMPRTRIPFVTTLGMNGFVIYLVHGLVIRVFQIFDLFPPTQNFSLKWLAVLTAGAIALSALLGSPLMAKLFRFLAQPKAYWLIRKTDKPVVG